MSHITKTFTQEEKEAVRVAMKYDIYTGGEILKVEIER